MVDNCCNNGSIVVTLIVVMVIVVIMVTTLLLHKYGYNSTILSMITTMVYYISPMWI